MDSVLMWGYSNSEDAFVALRLFHELGGAASPGVIDEAIRHWDEGLLCWNASEPKLERRPWKANGLLPKKDPIRPDSKDWRTAKPFLIQKQVEPEIACPNTPSLQVKYPVPEPFLVEIIPTVEPC